MEKYEGLTTALVSDLYPDERINVDGTRRFVDFQINNGARNLLVNGTTGQGPILRRDDWVVNTAAVINQANGKVPVFVGCGEVTAREAVEKTQTAVALGANATLHDTGYKLKTPQLGYIQYFSDVAYASSGKPVIIYDVRSRGHPAIQPRTRLHLAKKFDNVYMVKEASGSQEDREETRKLAEEYGFDEHRFKQLSGDDADTLHMMKDPKIKAVGVISVWANIFPQVYATMTELALEGRYGEAREIDDRLNELNGLVTVKNVTTTIDGETFLDNYPNPEAVQYATHLLGMVPGSYMVSPLGTLPKEGQQRVAKALANLYFDERTHNWFDPIKRFFKMDVETVLKPYK